MIYEKKTNIIVIIHCVILAGIIILDLKIIITPQKIKSDKLKLINCPEIEDTHLFNIYFTGLIKWMFNDPVFISFFIAPPIFIIELPRFMKKTRSEYVIISFR